MDERKRKIVRKESLTADYGYVVWQSIFSLKAFFAFKPGAG
jgi:hypothetical protein